MDPYVARLKSESCNFNWRNVVNRTGNILSEEDARAFANECKRERQARLKDPLHGTHFQAISNADEMFETTRFGSDAVIFRTKYQPIKIENLFMFALPSISARRRAFLDKTGGVGDLMLSRHALPVWVPGDTMILSRYAKKGYPSPTKNDWKALLAEFKEMLPLLDVPQIQTWLKKINKRYLFRTASTKLVHGGMLHWYEATIFSHHFFVYEDTSGERVAVRDRPRWAKPVATPILAEAAEAAEASSDSEPPEPRAERSMPPHDELDALDFVANVNEAEVATREAALGVAHPNPRAAQTRLLNRSFVRHAYILGYDAGMKAAARV